MRNRHGKTVSRSSPLVLIRRRLSAYRDMISLVGSEIRRLKIPAVVITGKHAIKFLEPVSYVECKLDSGKAIACFFGIAPFEPNMRTADIIDALAITYRCVGDFFCGYGNTGWGFVQRGRRYVMSDLDAQCVGYIADHEAQW
jgi:hypothetical protein